MDIKDITNTPTLEQLNTYINNAVFTQFYETVHIMYQPQVKIEYSKDSLLRGWNIKFRKASRSLCVIYPKQNYFTVLVVIGKKEKERVENILPKLSQQVQTIYHTTKEGMGQRWLMIDVYERDSVYEDVFTLIQIRRTSDIKQKNCK